MKIKLLLFFTVYFCSLIAQDNCLPDSSKNNFNSIKDFEKQIRYKINLAVNFSHTDRVRSECIFKDVVQISLEKNDPNMIVFTLTNLANHFLSYGENDTAVTSIGMAKKYNSNNLQKKIKLKLMATEAEYFNLINQQEKNIELRNQILNLSYQINDSILIAGSMHNLAIGYYKIGKTTKADSLLNLAYAINKRIKNENFLIRNLTMLANISQRQKNWKQGLKYNLEAIALGEKRKDYNIVCVATCNNCQNYYYLGRKKECYESLDRAILLGSKFGFREWRKNAYSFYADFLFKDGDYKRAYIYSAKYSALKDSLFDESTSRTLAGMEQELNKNKVSLLEKENQISIDKNIQSLLELKKEKTVRYFTFAGIAILAFFLIMVYRNFLIKKKTNARISEQNELLADMNKEIAEKKLHLELKNKEVVDSINYAQKIQYTLLANEAILKNNLSDYFIFFKPKAIVSGDFYWATEKDNKFYFAVCDSTGHGVPGAFMSLLNINYLNEAINVKAIYKPHEILDNVRNGLTSHSATGGTKDGMDAVLVCWDKKQNTIEYAAAYNKPIRIRNGELTVLPYDKMPVGLGVTNKPFILQSDQIKKGDTIYLCSDGYVDQFGGPDGKKFKQKQLEEALLSVADLPMHEQQKLLSEKFNQWQGSLEQIDDVLMVGIKI